MKLKILFVLVGTLIAVGNIQANEAGKLQELLGTCASCHGEDGNSSVETNPKLAGQYESYLVQALKSYRDGTRQNAIMAGFASSLSDRDIKELAAYFAAQTPVLATATQK